MCKESIEGNLCESKRGKLVGRGLDQDAGRAIKMEDWVEGATDGSTALRKSQQMGRARKKVCLYEMTHVRLK